MKLPPFKLEEYFAQWEFNAEYLFCSSDIESLSMQKLLEMADEESKGRWEKLKLSYTETAGLPALRAEASQLYENLSPDDIYTFSGAEEGILCSFLALLSPNDHVVAIAPYYQSLESVPQSIGAEVSVVPLRNEREWILDMDEFESALRPNTKMIVLNYPHHPTGALLPLNSLEKIVSLARERGAYIFSDEVYRYLELNPAERTPAIADLYERGISLHVLSKAYGLPGLRIGWIATQDQAARRAIASVKHYSSICNSAPSEILALIALRAREKLFARSHKIMGNNLKLLEPFFTRHADKVRWVRPKGSCTAYPELLLSIPIGEFAKELVREKGLLILPATVYSEPTNHFRIGFGRENMPEALGHFEAFLISKAM